MKNHPPQDLLTPPLPERSPRSSRCCGWFSSCCGVSSSKQDEETPLPSAENNEDAASRPLELNDRNGDTGDDDDDEGLNLRELNSYLDAKDEEHDCETKATNASNQHNNNNLATEILHVLMGMLTINYWIQVFQNKRGAGGANMITAANAADGDVDGDCSSKKPNTVAVSAAAAAAAEH